MISEEIRESRVSMGMNRKEFCEYFDIPYRTMSDWEAGKRKMPEYLLKLMEYKTEIEKLVSVSLYIEPDHISRTCVGNPWNQKVGVD